MTNRAITECQRCGAPITPGGRVKVAVSWEEPVRRTDRWTGEQKSGFEAKCSYLHVCRDCGRELSATLGVSVPEGVR